jgi:hypothetical protein
MFFRPEEMHGASGAREVVEPLPKRNSHVTRYTLWLGVDDLSIADFYSNGETAIQTRAINANYFAWKEPADCQRFKSSLSEPLLLTIDGDSVLVGEIAERSKGGN